MYPIEYFGNRFDKIKELVALITKAREQRGNKPFKCCYDLFAGSASLTLTFLEYEYLKKEKDKNYVFANKYVINDVFAPVINFWKQIQNEQSANTVIEKYNELLENYKEKCHEFFHNLLQEVNLSIFDKNGTPEQAAMFCFVINHSQGGIPLIEGKGENQKLVCKIIEKSDPLPIDDAFEAAVRKFHNLLKDKSIEFTSKSFEEISYKDFPQLKFEQDDLVMLDPPYPDMPDAEQLPKEHVYQRTESKKNLKKGLKNLIHQLEAQQVTFFMFYGVLGMENRHPIKWPKGHVLHLVGNEDGPFNKYVEHLYLSSNLAKLQCDRSLGQEVHTVNQEKRTDQDKIQPCFHQIFETQAYTGKCKNGDRMAIVWGKERYTYDQINKAANRLANCLLENGLKQKIELNKKFGKSKGDTLIALYLDRGPQLVISMLAVMKTGAAFLPLDTNCERLSPTAALDRIKKSKANFIVSDKELYASLNFIKVKKNDYLFEELPFKDENNLNHESNLNRYIDPQSLAYVMYTSGSTGEPKGVEILHRGLPYAFESHQDLLNLGRDDRIAQFASIGFDASLMEIMMALGSGAELHIINDEYYNDISKITQLLKDNKITVAIQTPKMLELLHPTDFPDLRAVFIVGDKFSQSLSNAWIQDIPNKQKEEKSNEIVSVSNNTNIVKASNSSNVFSEESLQGNSHQENQHKNQHFYKKRKVINGYGLTETTICTTLELCSKEKKLSIGQPILGCEVKLKALAEEENDSDNNNIALDENTTWLPPKNQDPEIKQKEYGELYIAGPCVARGYWENEEIIHNNRFKKIQNPSKVFYQTGDKGYYIRETGEIILKGRLDRQHKIRGQRVELGEIEKKLLELLADLISEARVVVHKREFLRQGDNGSQCFKANILSAYLVPKDKKLVITDRTNPSKESIDALKRVKEQLLKNLPKYMCPSLAHMLWVEELPEKIGNDKKGYDDKAMKENWPLPCFTQAEDNEFLDSLTPEEQEDLESIHRTFSEVLEITDNQLRYQDNFYDVSGDSLTVNSLVARLKQLSTIDPNIKKVLAQLTIAKFNEVNSEGDNSSVKGLWDYLKLAKEKEVNNQNEIEKMERKKTDNIMSKSQLMFSERGIILKSTLSEIKAIKKFPLPVYAFHALLGDADLDYDNSYLNELPCSYTKLNLLDLSNHPNIDDIVNFYSIQIKNSKTQGTPYTLWFVGWSTGGYIAKLVANKLRNEDHNIRVNVLLLDSYHPSLLQNMNSEQHKEMLIENLAKIRDALLPILKLGKDEKGKIKLPSDKDINIEDKKEQILKIFENFNTSINEYIENKKLEENIANRIKHMLACAEFFLIHYQTCKANDLKLHEDDLLVVTDKSRKGWKNETLGWEAKSENSIKSISEGHFDLLTNKDLEPILKDWFTNKIVDLSKNFYEGITAALKYEYNNAVHCFSKLLQEENGNRYARLIRANAYMQLKDYTKAFEDYLVLLENNKNDQETISHFNNAYQIFKQERGKIMENTEVIKQNDMENTEVLKQIENFFNGKKDKFNDTESVVPEVTDTLTPFTPTSAVPDKLKEEGNSGSTPHLEDTEKLEHGSKTSSDPIIKESCASNSTENHVDDEKNKISNSNKKLESEKQPLDDDKNCQSHDSLREDKSDSEVLRRKLDVGFEEKRRITKGNGLYFYILALSGSLMVALMAAIVILIRNKTIDIRDIQSFWSSFEFWINKNRSLKKVSSLLKETYIKQAGQINLLVYDKKELRIQNYISTNLQTENGEIVNFESLFPINSASTVTIISSPMGHGKSIWCKNAAYLWSQDKLWANRFELVIFFPLIELNALISNTNYENFEDIISDLVIPQSYEGRILTNYVLRDESLFNKTLFILDGFDEIYHLVSNPEEQSKLDKIIEKIVNQYPSITTTRKYCQKAIVEKYHCTKSEGINILEISKFSKIDVEHYVKNYFENLYGNQKKSKELIEKLYQNSKLNEITKVPLYLQFICKLYSFETFKEKISIAEIYDEILYSISMRFLFNHSHGSKAKSEVENKSKLHVHVIGQIADKLIGYESSLTANLKEDEKTFIFSRYISNFINITKGMSFYDSVNRPLQNFIDNLEKADKLTLSIINFGVFDTFKNIEPTNAEVKFIHNEIRDFFAAKMDYYEYQESPTPDRLSGIASDYKDKLENYQKELLENENKKSIAKNLDILEFDPPLYNKIRFFTGLLFVNEPFSTDIDKQNSPARTFISKLLPKDKYNVELAILIFEEILSIVRGDSRFINSQISKISVAIKENDDKNKFKDLNFSNRVAKILSVSPLVLKKMTDSLTGKFDEKSQIDTLEFFEKIRYINDVLLIKLLDLYCQPNQGSKTKEKIMNLLRTVPVDNYYDCNGNILDKYIVRFKGNDSSLAEVYVLKKLNKIEEPDLQGWINILSNDNVDIKRKIEIVKIIVTIGFNDNKSVRAQLIKFIGQIDSEPEFDLIILRALLRLGVTYDEIKIKFPLKLTNNYLSFINFIKVISKGKSNDKLEKILDWKVEFNGAKKTIASTIVSSFYNAFNEKNYELAGELIQFFDTAYGYLLSDEQLHILEKIKTAQKDEQIKIIYQKLFEITKHKELLTELDKKYSFTPIKEVDENAFEIFFKRVFKALGLSSSASTLADHAISTSFISSILKSPTNVKEFLFSNSNVNLIRDEKINLEESIRLSGEEGLNSNLQNEAFVHQTNEVINDRNAYHSSFFKPSIKSTNHALGLSSSNSDDMGSMVLFKDKEASTEVNAKLALQNIHLDSLNINNDANLHHVLALDIAGRYKVPVQSVSAILNQTGFESNCNEALTQCQVTLSNDAVVQINALVAKTRHENIKSTRHENTKLVKTNPSVLTVLDSCFTLSSFAFAVFLHWYNKKQTYSLEDRVLGKRAFEVIERNLLADIQRFEEKLNDLDDILSSNLNDEYTYAEYLLKDLKERIGEFRIGVTTVGDLNDAVYTRRYIQTILFPEAEEIITTGIEAKKENRVTDTNHLEDNNIIKNINKSSFFSQITKNVQHEKLNGEETVKQKLVDRVPGYFKLGAVLGGGDCFFDAIAQALNALTGKEEYTAKSLRLLCDEYVKDPTNAEWVKAAVIKNGSNYEQYLAHIQFTSEEIEEMKQQGEVNLGRAEQGNPYIEGRIICQVLQAKHNLNITLHVIEVYKAANEEITVFEQLIDAVNTKTMDILTSEGYEIPEMLHIVNYQNHFVPLLANRFAKADEKSMLGADEAEYRLTA